MELQQDMENVPAGSPKQLSNANTPRTLPFPPRQGAQRSAADFPPRSTLFPLHGMPPGSWPWHGSLTCPDRGS